MSKALEMKFKSVYNSLVAKAQRKGKTQDDVNKLTSWMTGYGADEIDLIEDMSYGEFFEKAPNYNANRENIKGKICGVQIENIEDEIMREVRRLDKLIDELAKGKTVEQIIEKYSRG